MDRVSWWTSHIYVYEVILSYRHVNGSDNYDLPPVKFFGCQTPNATICAMCSNGWLIVIRIHVKHPTKKRIRSAWPLNHLLTSSPFSCFPFYFSTFYIPVCHSLYIYYCFCFEFLTCFLVDTDYPVTWSQCSQYRQIFCSLFWFFLVSGFSQWRKKDVNCWQV